MTEEAAAKFLLGIRASASAQLLGPFKHAHMHDIAVTLRGGPWDGQVVPVRDGQKWIQLAPSTPDQLMESIRPDSRPVLGYYDISPENPNIYEWTGWCDPRSLISTDAPIKRYVIFGHDAYEPKGGWADFLGSTDDLDCAKDYCRSSPLDMTEIIDMNTGEDIAANP